MSPLATVRFVIGFSDRPFRLEEMRQWEVLRTELRTGAQYRPLATAVRIGALLASGVTFVGLLASLYLLNPAVVLLVGGLGLFGLLVVAGSLELRYRRELRERRRLQTALADGFPLVRPRQMPLDAITGVTVRPVSTRRLLSDGCFFLVRFQDKGKPATTPLGVPEFVSERIDTARALFERHDIRVTDDE
ncbi:MAG: hypothetical protein ABEJ05_14290 [Haloglomus sp.]